MDEEVFIPIVGFISLAAVTVLFIYYRFRTRFEIQKTVRAAIERGQQLSPDFLDRLADPRPTRRADRDLRIGVTSMALGLGLASFGWLVGSSDLVGPLLAIGNIPFLVGVAFVGLWKFAPREEGRV